MRRPNVNIFLQQKTDTCFQGELLPNNNAPGHFSGPGRIWTCVDL